MFMFGIKTKIMKRYYVNRSAQANGDHEVHVEGCYFMPSLRIDLGLHHSCHTAIVEAAKYYHQTNGCKYCCKECHTS